MRDVAGSNDAVIVESHGKPKVAVISIDRYDALLHAEAASKREADLEWLRNFEQTHSDPTIELSDEEIEELPVRSQSCGGAHLKAREPS